MRGTPWAALLALAVACGASGEPRRAEVTPPEPAAPPSPTIGPVPAEPQRDGDPAVGFARLLDGGYVGCGMPRRVYDQVAGTTPGWMKVPGRTGAGADLPYFLNAFTNADGVELVTANCLGCHASFLGGSLVIGLGDASGDFTLDVAAPMSMGGFLISGDAERAAWNKFTSRVRTLSPFIKTRTVGANPADVIASVLFAHREPTTLAWSDEAISPLPKREPPVPLDVPAWWHTRKKTALYYTGAGRGDHARMMMTVSVLCIDDVDAAAQIDGYFPDIAAYIRSLEPPSFPGIIDDALAAEGKALFEGRCSDCHGTYGPNAVYPTRIVATDEVGTDPALQVGASEFTGMYAAWFNQSFYGERARLQPTEGYVAPPLDGVWATAPYFHNGAVPTLAAVLDPALRPTRYRIVRGSRRYDLDSVGWPAPVAREDERGKHIYDASLPGYSVAGHDYGTEFEPAERRAILEYLKTL